MKKIVFLIALVLTIIGCSTPDEQSFDYEITPVSSVIMPTEFAADSITTISVKYKRPSSCHIFNRFYYETEGYTRTVAIENLKVNQSNCQTDGVTTLEVPLKFNPVATGTYHFKFWTGADAQGVDQYLEYDVVVDH